MTCSITFLFGAGFSTPYGIPTMRPFLDSFRKMAKQKYPDLHDTLERHFKALEDDSDIEALLSSLGKAERLVEAMPHGATIPEEYEVWQKKSRYLKSHLISYIIEQCERYDKDLVTQVLSPGLQELYDLAGLDNIHIFTTNYDRVIEHACNVSGVEFSDGFGSTDNELVAPWTRFFDKKMRIYKLHGSVSYYVDQKGDGAPSFLRLDRGYPLPGPNFRLSREGNELEPMMVLPTLEKDALGEPYSHLNHLFTEIVSHTLLVVAVGTSLRDKHIVSAINYNKDNVVVLLVDLNPNVAGCRIPEISNIKLKADAKTFFECSISRLTDVISTCIGKQSKDEIYSAVEQFVTDEAIFIEQSIYLTDCQNKAFNCVLSSQSDQELLEALQQLRGVNKNMIVQAIAGKGKGVFPVDVRKAAVACLGHSNNLLAVGALEGIAKEDTSPDVRLEAYLALRTIGTEVASKALEGAQERWPDDSYFWD